MSKRKACHNASFPDLLVNEANMAYSSMPYVGMALKKKMAATLKVHKLQARNVCVS